MEGMGLPNIREIYRCTRENRDYNVIRKYEGGHKSALNVKPTKRNHYLDEEIRLNCSPGPASTCHLIQILETIRIHGPRSLYCNPNEEKN